MVDIILTSFVVLGGALALITLHSSWLLTKTKRTVLTWVYPIAVISLIIFASKGVVDIQGYPINGKPAGDWEYVTHAMEGEAALVIVKVDEPRTYRFIPTEAEKKKLEEGGKATKKGQRPILNMDSEIPKMKLVRLDEEHPK